MRVNRTLPNGIGSRSGNAYSLPQERATAGADPQTVVPLANWRATVPRQLKRAQRPTA
jgi:hypothetical protein